MDNCRYSITTGSLGNPPTLCYTWIDLTGVADEDIGEADEDIGEADEYIRIRLIQERVLCQPTLFSTPIYW